MSSRSCAPRRRAATFSNRPSLLFNSDLPADRRNVIGARLKRLGCRDPRLVRERAEEQEGTCPSAASASFI
jgi:hypothetical protein